ncbi:acyl-CoA thioesterase [Phreatobacter stygius]|uniref:Acyl-CoA thioesterase n=1 Tax=Phreatobacter stygius TaxID=1940610 RepID=A0A4D7AZE9_9HYPH|nr:acyl-CoA thioesterase [Phreatobacter stygius]QCI64735.1 acyl-CoA thioesterase [Phreatobacter stygius]
MSEPGFQCRFTIEWGDCDEAGIVYYPRYLDLFDRTFQGFLRSRGLSQRVLRARFGIVGTAIVEAHAEFRGPATYDDELVAMASITAWHDRRFRIDYRLVRADKPIVTGYEDRAWVGRDPAGRLAGQPIPEAFRTAME